MGKLAATDRAMLKVAYLLSTMTGEIGKLECEAFKTLCFANNTMTPGSKEANSFLEEVVSEAENLKKLSKFYSEEEFMLAFASKVMQECKKLKEDAIVSRKAFAVWVGLCMADGKYTEEEKTYIKILQQMFVKDFDLEYSMKSLLTPGTTLLGLTSPGLMGIFLGGKVIQHTLQKQGNAEIISEEIISDDFLKELEENCQMLSNLKVQIDATADAAQKESLQNSFNYIEESLKELIKNGLN